MEIKYTPNNPLKFISTKSFVLGSSGINILDGMELLFDGNTLEVNGERFSLPTFRGAIKSGWAVLAEEYDPEAPMEAPVSANIGVRPANDLGSNPLAPAKRTSIVTTESDERIVMSSTARTQQAANQTREVRNQQARPTGVVRGNAVVEAGGAEFGVEVPRTFKTAAKARSEVTPNSVGSLEREANQVKIEPGVGISEEQMLANMSEGDQENYLAEKEARKIDIQSRSKGYKPPPTNRASTTQGKTASGATQVGRITRAAKPVVSEGFTVGTTTTSGGTEIFDASGPSGKVEESVVSSEGITFRNTNGPKKAFPGLQKPSPVVEESVPKIERDGTADARVVIAKMICKDFPDNYDFGEHWKRRLANLRLNFEGRHDIILAVFAAESDDFKKILQDEFPEAFQG